MRTLRIGNGCGFWGDNLDAPALLAQHGSLDYLTLEYLAELTMSILALQKERDPNAGYANDFLDVLRSLVPVLKSQPRLKIVTNAGGMNPLACAKKAKDILSAAGLTRKIAVISRDDLMPQLSNLVSAGERLQNLDTGEEISSVQARIVSANAYLGAEPIAMALEQGAEIVVTGRVADASLTVGPAAFEFGWPWNDWDRLAAGTVAGHLIECGAQVTGGLWCNWQEAADLANVGYPIAELGEDGSFTISKPPQTGGAVNIETVSEQLLYEVADPAAYLTPDVTADFASVSLAQEAKDVVRVSRAKGRPATDSYKVSVAYRDGFMASGTLVIAGPEAKAKARLCGEMILSRLARAGITPERSNIECLGAGECVPQPMRPEPPEVVLRVSVHDSRRGVVERFTKEFAPLVTSGPPGVTGYTTGRAPVREVFAYWPTLISKKHVTPQVEVLQ